MSTDAKPLFEGLTIDEEPQFYRWRDAQRDYIGQVTEWRRVAALEAEVARLKGQLEAADPPKKCPGCAVDVPAALDAHLPECSVRQWHEAMDDMEADRG